MENLRSRDEILEMIIRDIKKMTKTEIVVEMLSDNLEFSKISRYTHFSLEKINEISENIAEGREDVVIEMLKDNEDPSKISKFTHFSLEKINEIEERLTNNLQLAGE